MAFKCLNPTCSPLESHGRKAHGIKTVLDPYGCDLYTSAALGNGSDGQEGAAVVYYRKKNATAPHCTWLVRCLNPDCTEFARRPLKVACSPLPAPLLSSLTPQTAAPPPAVIDQHP